MIALATLALALAQGVTSGRYSADIEKWRAEREAGLKADGGWLTVAGLFWLKEGTNRFGTDPAGEIVLPKGSAPPHVGVFELGERGVAVRVEAGATVTAAGKPVVAMELRPDTSGPPDVLEVGALTLHVIKRGGRYGIRLKDMDSAARRRFAGLKWFPAREAYCVKARFVPAPSMHKIAIPNVLGQVEDLPSPGRAVFMLNGKESSLHPVLESPDAKELFFIFKDQTSGHETYGAGRFLYAEMPKDGTVVLDFNKAYSPPCAFTSYATCPLPPKENRLEVRIEAGELNPGH